MRTSKLERLFSTDSSRALRTFVLLADGLYSISSEYECESSGDVVNGEVLVYYRGCELGRELFELGELRESGVSVRFISGVGGSAPSELLERASLYALELVSELESYVWTTLRSGVEYVLLVLRTGDVYVAEGDVWRISLPYVSGALLEAHTHPTSCVPSDRDATTAMERFMEGLYATAIVGPDCTTLAYRRSPPSEEDLVAMRELPVAIERIAPGPGRVDLGSIRVVIVPR